MDIFVVIMCVLSSFGFFIIFSTLYLLITVPTKLTAFTRFAIHGHDLSSAIAQIYLTLGLMPYILLPCTSGFTVGLFSHFHLMSVLTQAWSQFVLIAINASFSLLLYVNRAFAVSERMSKWKNLILKIFFVQLLGQIVFLMVAGRSIKDGGDRAQKICQEKLKSDYPLEMFSGNGVNVISSENIGFRLILIYGGLAVFFYLTVSGICGVILIRNIRTRVKSSQSVALQACQRRMTIGVIYFVLLELIGLGIPVLIVSLSGWLGIGSLIVGQYACISICVYPLFGSYYMLMSSSDYRNRVIHILKRARQVKIRVPIVNPSFTRAIS